jgi:hypothetical protein
VDDARPASRSWLTMVAMTRRPVWLSEERRDAGLVVPLPCDPTGVMGPTEKQARGPHWRRSSRGLYVPEYVDSSVVEQRIVEAAARLPLEGSVTGWASLRWRGAEWFTGLDRDGRTPLPVPLAIPTGDIRPQPGIAISEEGMRLRDAELFDGIWLTSACRSVLFEVRHARTVETAVEVLDMAAYSDLVSIAEMAAHAAAAGPVTGIIQARKALALAEENSWSPRETGFRLVWERGAGRPRPLPNVPVFDLAGRHLATPDLLDPEAGVMGEYEGSVHLTGARRGSDVRREEQLRDVGLEGVTMTATDLTGTDALVARIDAAYGRARRLDRSARAWTTTRPPWWVDTDTVAARRALSSADRERLLRYRRAS